MNSRQWKRRKINSAREKWENLHYTSTVQTSLPAEQRRKEKIHQEKFTCDGADAQPQLCWCKKGIPKGTKSLTIIVDDPDAIPVTGSVFTHFAVTDIPAASISSCVTEKNVQGTVMKNDFGNFDWGGPCPPPGDPPHRYRFALYALDIDTNLPPSTKLTMEIFERLFRPNILAKSKFSAFYQRKVQERDY